MGILPALIYLQHICAGAYKVQKRTSELLFSYWSDTNNCEPPDRGAEKQIQVLGKSRCGLNSQPSLQSLILPSDWLISVWLSRSSHSFSLSPFANSFCFSTEITERSILKRCPKRILNTDKRTASRGPCRCTIPGNGEWFCFQGPDCLWWSEDNCLTLQVTHVLRERNSTNVRVLLYNRKGNPCTPQAICNIFFYNEMGFLSGFSVPSAFFSGSWS